MDDETDCTRGTHGKYEKMHALKKTRRSREHRLTRGCSAAAICKHEAARVWTGLK
jgi:hypothetical protein